MVALDPAPSFLSIVLSAATASLSLDVVIVYHDTTIDRMVRYWSKPVDEDGMGIHPDMVVTNALSHQQRFELFREMYKAREFRLMLCADVHDCFLEYAIRVLECIVDAERTKGELDYLRELPVISYF